MATKALEAEEHIKKAEKYLKTSVLKWKPDIDSAVDEYNQAALCYKTARMQKESAEMHIKSAELQVQNGSLFHAAKSLELAGHLYKEVKDFQKMADQIAKAGQMFRESGTPDTASIMYEKAAKALETPMPDKAAEFYLKSADASEIEEKWRQAAEQAGQAARMWVRLGRLEDAVTALELKLSMYGREGDSAADVAGKTVTALVLVHLTRQDSVAASKVYHRAVGSNEFSRTDDAGPVARVLRLFEEQDPDGCAQVLQAPTFKYMENEYAKLARDLKVPGESGKSQSAAGDEEEEEGLC